MAGICATDLEILRGYKGFRGVLGHEFVGEVVDGPDSAWIGKRVCGEINVGCGSCDFCASGVSEHCRNREVLGILNRDGAFADFLSLPTNNLHELADSVSDEEAVFVEPLAAAFEILEQVPLSGSETAAVLGDGKLGNLCAQVVKSAGCRVTVFGRHKHKLDILRQLGIDAEDGQPRIDYDVVVEATGSPTGVEQAIAMVKPRGTLVLKSTVATPSSLDLSPIVVKELNVVGSRCGPFPRSIRALQDGTVQVKPLIEAVYSLHEGMAAIAHARRRGVMKVLLDMREGSA